MVGRTVVMMVMEDMDIQVLDTGTVAGTMDVPAETVLEEAEDSQAVVEEIVVGRAVAVAEVIFLAEDLDDNHQTESMHLKFQDLTVFAYTCTTSSLPDVQTCQSMTPTCSTIVDTPKCT
jgi:hypothetical protein